MSTKVDLRVLRKAFLPVGLAGMIVWGCCLIHAQEAAPAPESQEEVRLGIQPGDSVVALRDAELRVKATAVGTVKKGEALVVKNIQDDWLWIEQPNKQGWIRRWNVVCQKVLDRLSQMPDLAEPEGATTVYERFLASSDSRAVMKAYGVAFELEGVTPQEQASILAWIPQGGGILGVEGLVDSNTVVIKGHRLRLPEGQYITFAFRRWCILLRPLGRDVALLQINGRRYDTVRRGDHVLICEDGRVYVNGSLRRGQ